MAKSQSTNSEDVTSLGFELETKQSIAASATRDHSAASVLSFATSSPKKEKEREVAEFTLEDGSVWYATQEDLEELYQHRDLESKVRATSKTSKEFEFAPDLFETQSSRGNSELRVRSVVSGKIKKAVKSELTKRFTEAIDEEISKLGSAVIDSASFALARLIEKRVSEFDGISQVCRVRYGAIEIELEPCNEALPQSEEPWLCLLYTSDAADE